MTHVIPERTEVLCPSDLSFTLLSMCQVRHSQDPHPQSRSSRLCSSLFESRPEQILLILYALFCVENIPNILYINFYIIQMISKIKTGCQNEIIEGSIFIKNKI